MWELQKHLWPRLSQSYHVATSSLKRSAARLHDAGWDFLLPPTCVGCGDAVSSTPVLHQCRRQICDACRGALCEIVSKPFCQRCGASVGPYVNSEYGCLECSREKFAFKNVYRLGLYKGLLRDAVLKGKYLGGEPLLMSLVDLLWESFQGPLQNEGIGLVVPIPQHWRQRLLTRHHAPDVMSEAWGRYLRVPAGLPILSKRRATIKQAKLSRVQRRKNQEDVYRVRYPKIVQGKSILLVDDVLTTGATADSAARALKAAGATKVVVAVIARVMGPR